MVRLEEVRRACLWAEYAMLSKYMEIDNRYAFFREFGGIAPLCLRILRSGEEQVIKV
mgnify:CR=1 FL=1